MIESILRLSGNSLDFLLEFNTTVMFLVGHICLTFAYNKIEALVLIDIISQFNLRFSDSGCVISSLAKCLNPVKTI